ILEWHGVSRLFYQLLYDVEAVLRLDKVRVLVWAQAEGCLLKFRDGLTLSDPAQVTTFVFRSRVFRVLFRQVSELVALLNLLLPVLGLFLYLIHFRMLRLPDSANDLELD